LKEKRAATTHQINPPAKTTAKPPPKAPNTSTGSKLPAQTLTSTVTKGGRDFLTGDYLGRAGKNLLALAAVGGTLYLGAKAIDAATDAVVDPTSRKINLKRTLKANPDLKQYDKKDLKQHFRTIAHFSPRTASDPLAAGATLRRFMAYKDVGPQATDLKTLSDIEKGVADSRKSRFGVGKALEPANLSSLSSLG
jgi:hypothetical protein